MQALIIQILFRETPTSLRTTYRNKGKSNRDFEGNILKYSNIPK